MSQSLSAAHNCWEGVVWAYTARLLLQGSPLGGGVGGGGGVSCK